MFIQRTALSETAAVYTRLESFQTLNVNVASILLIGVATWTWTSLTCLIHLHISSQSTLAQLTPSCWYGVWITNLGALPIISSVPLRHIPCLFACIYESVSCVYDFFSTCASTCVARTACFVFCSIFITTFLFSFFISYKFNRHLRHGAYWCTHSLLICLSSSSVYISICVIHAYVYVNLYTHFPPLPYSYTFIAIFICIYVSTIV